jgi:ABC-type molybdate transport system substrate-binding protein
VMVKGAPILYGLSVPQRAPHPESAVQLAAFVVGAEGARLLRRAHVDVLPAPIVVGTGAPAALVPPTQP